MLYFIINIYICNFTDLLLLSYFLFDIFFIIFIFLNKIYFE